MSYQNKLDEISEKLQKLQSGGGVTRPLVPAAEDFGMALARKLDEVAEGITGLKTEMREFRQKALSQLGDIDQKVRSLSAVGRAGTAEVAATASAGDDKAFGSILDEINALKENIQSVLTLENE